MRRSHVPYFGLASFLAALAGGCGDSDPGGDDDDDSAGGSSGTGTGYGTGTGTGNGTSTGTGNGTGTGTGTEGCPEIDPKLCGIVAAHNAVRANVSPAANPPLPPLTWNPDAAAVAASWAATCQFAHNPMLGSLGLGENIFMTSGSATPGQVVGLWASEVSDYDYASNSCSAVCGHYTQIVWRDTTSVGCAAQSCPQGEIWVCDYSPPGNYVGQQPY